MVRNAKSIQATMRAGGTGQGPGSSAERVCGCVFYHRIPGREQSESSRRVSEADKPFYGGWPQPLPAGVHEG